MSSISQMMLSPRRIFGGGKVCTATVCQQQQHHHPSSPSWVAPGIYSAKPSGGVVAGGDAVGIMTPEVLAVNTYTAGGGHTGAVPKRSPEKEAQRTPPKRTPHKASPLNGNDAGCAAFMTCSPSPSKRKHKTGTTKQRRTPSTTLFSPTYPYNMGAHLPRHGGLAPTHPSTAAPMPVDTSVSMAVDASQQPSSAVGVGFRSSSPVTADMNAMMRMSIEKENSGLPEAPLSTVGTATPTLAALTPLQRSLQENIAQYGHLPQEFDEYAEQEFDPYQFIATLQNLSPSSAPYNRPRMSCLPPKDPNAPSVTLVLDLDETLAHCSTNATDIPYPDFSFEVEFNGVIYVVYAKKRPGFEEFMEHIKGKFEIVVFTASQRVYAEKLLDILDKNRKCISHRVFRDSCVNVEGNYIKDLTALGRDLSKTIIVDNSPQAFSFQLECGIPVLSWFDSEDDRELYKLCPLLDQLALACDVRPILRSRFQLYRKVEERQGKELTFDEIWFADTNGTAVRNN